MQITHCRRVTGKHWRHVNPVSSKKPLTDLLNSAGNRNNLSSTSPRPPPPPPPCLSRWRFNLLTGIKTVCHPEKETAVTTFPSLHRLGVRLRLRWGRYRAYHVMHGNQGNREIKVLHARGDVKVICIFTFKSTGGRGGSAGAPLPCGPSGFLKSRRRLYVHASAGTCITTQR